MPFNVFKSPGAGPQHFINLAPISYSPHGPNVHPDVYNNGHSTASRSQSHTKSRRSSQSGSWPYDAARSPVRARFNPQDTNVPAPYPNLQFDYSHSPNRSQMDRQSRSDRNSKSHSKYPQDENLVPLAMPGVNGPMNHVLVPQYTLTEPNQNSQFLFPSIEFQLKDFPEPGVKISDILSKRCPDIVGQDDHVFKNLTGKVITLDIMWPGYKSEAETKRLNTLDRTMTRQELLITLARTIGKFASRIQDSGIPIKRGFEQWTLGQSANGRRGIQTDNLFITKLVHRGTSQWQVELWTAKEML